MKALVLLVVSVLSSSAFAAPASKAVVCSSVENVTNQKMLFTAYVPNSRKIEKAQVKGAFESDVRTITADNNYNPVNPAYLNYNRFSTLEDNWCWFTPLLPKNVASLNVGKAFVGYIQMVCEEGRNRQTIRLNCTVR